MTMTDALSMAAEVAGIDAKPRLAPRAVATIGGACVEAAFRLRGKHPPVCREMVRTLLHGHRYDGSRAERELGLTYTPAIETLRKTIEWARARACCATPDARSRSPAPDRPLAAQRLTARSRPATPDRPLAPPR